MAVIAGIDEAGYGPLLGPLVVAATAFRVPAQRQEADLWDALSAVVCPAIKGAKGRLAIGDSKKIYHRASGIRHLEEGVLAFLMSGGKRPKSFRELLAVLGAPCVREEVGLEAYPWYRGRDAELPLEAVRPRLIEQADRLARAAAAAGVEYIGTRCTPVEVAELNRMFARTRNKSLALWSINARLLWALWTGFAGEGLLIVLDKHGARTRYTNLLLTAFPEIDLKVEQEDQNASRYLLRQGSAWMRLVIREKAEEAALPVALASMHAKYVRELFMELFNRFWREMDGDLKPTAGYRQDGKRFLADAAELLRRVPHHTSQLIRDL
jgi:ribonuclease HII